VHEGSRRAGVADTITYSTHGILNESVEVRCYCKTLTETFTSHRLPSEWTRLEKFTKDTYIGLLHEMNSNGVRIPRRVLPGDDGGGTAWSAWSVGLVGFGFVQTVFLASRPEQVRGVYTNKGALPAAGLIS
jgi:hypothetical protein